MLSRAPFNKRRGATIIGALNGRKLFRSHCKPQTRVEGCDPLRPVKRLIITSNPGPTGGQGAGGP
jgi:hypothetical protein